MRERRNLRGRHRYELGCQLEQATPVKPYFQNKHGSINKCSHASVRAAMPAASQLPERRHTDVDDAPAPER